MSDDHGERLTRLEVRQDGLKDNIDRVEKNTLEQIKGITSKIWWVVMLVFSIVISNLMGLISIGGGQ